jgi:hypothetical protein
MLGHVEHERAAARVVGRIRERKCSHRRRASPALHAGEPAHRRVAAPVLEPEGDQERACSAHGRRAAPLRRRGGDTRAHELHRHRAAQACARRSYWSGDVRSEAADAWRARQQPVQGTWWNDWTAWLDVRCGARVPARQAGSPAHPRLEAARHVRPRDPAFTQACARPRQVRAWRSKVTSRPVPRDNADLERHYLLAARFACARHRHSGRPMFSLQRT